MNIIEGTRQINPVTYGEGGFLLKITKKREWRLFIKNTGLCKI